MQRTTKSGPHDNTDTPTPARRRTVRNAASHAVSHEARAEETFLEGSAPEMGRRTDGPRIAQGVAGFDSPALDGRHRSRRIAERARARVDVEGYSSPAPRKTGAHGREIPRIARRVRATEHDGEATPAVKRSAAKRKMRNPFRRASLLTMIVAAVAGVVSMCLLVMIVMAQKDYNTWQAQVEFRQAQLAALEEQHDVGERRLAALASPKGRDQLLVEHGYLRPGDRILLFPSTPAEKRAADIPKNDLSPHPPLSPDSGSDPNASVWKRTADAFRSWLNSGH